ncbi:MAG: SusC/RagA family TonB-linked outer membrane protein [Lutibacter sp. BRH_c52]|nr:MAG: SusC/RagA family TonB-linked outer membrane protein [Lutibacter sp. BRH_c52]
MKTKFNGFLTLLLALLVQITFAQEKTVIGKVSDASGPLPGVTVLIKGTKTGSQTDFDGNFSVKANVGAVLQFSFVGMETTERTVGASNVINVTMQESAEALQEIIVMGYGTRGKNEITGSTVQLKGESISNVPVVSVDQALQGKVAGLTINSSSGTPGSTQDIRIRGVGSITAGNDPLFVIDGVPVISANLSGSTARSSLSALSSINSNDIESITVLKDASATSAFGARGSNGVIVITTKSGKSGKTSFKASSSYGFQNDAVDGNTPLSGAQRKELYLEALYNTLGAANGFTKENALTWLQANPVNDRGGLLGWDGTEYNWGKLVANKDATVHNIDVSATGGSEDSNFYTSLGYNKTEATVINSDFERITAALNFNRKFTDKLKFSVNLNGSNTRQNGFLEGAGYFGSPHLTKYFMRPWANPYNEDGTYNINNLGTSLHNTLFTMENNIATNDLTRAIVNSYLEWEIIENLKFKTLVSMDYNLANYKQYLHPAHGDGKSVNGSAANSDIRNFNQVYQNSLDYNFTLAGDHNFAVKALMEYQKNKYNYLYAYGTNSPTLGLTNVASFPTNRDATSSFSDWSNLSYLGMVNYNFTSKYIADFTYRREGSSRFSPGLRFGDFWSVGAAWNLHKENFIRDIKAIDELRLRASYGLSGSNSIDINSYQALLGYDADYAGNGAVYPSQFGNSDLSWEKNKNYDIGIDFKIFNKLSGSVAYFNKETYDLLQSVPLSSTSGHTSILKNIGTVVNKGIEVELNLDIIKTGSLNWSISGNYATLDNEVTELALDGLGEPINIETGTTIVKIGEPIRAWNMQKWAGVNPATGQPQWFINGVDGDVTSTYSLAQKAIQGSSAIPEYSGGFSTHIDFKGFFVDASVYLAGGNKVYESWVGQTHHAGWTSLSSFNGVTQLMDRWQQAGDITDVPKMVWNATGDQGTSTSTRFLYDGDYIRMKDLVVGYNVPEAFLKSTGINGITFSVRGTNLFTWVKDNRLKYDPETRADGFTQLITPPVKSVVFNVNLKF